MSDLVQKIEELKNACIAVGDAYGRGLDDETLERRESELREAEEAIRQSLAGQVSEPVAYQYRFFKWPAGEWAECTKQEFDDLRSGYEGRALFTHPLPSSSVAGVPALTAEERKALERFVECCEDCDAGGHDVSDAAMQRLRAIGAVTQKGRVWWVTEFGDWLLDAAPSAPSTVSAMGAGVGDADMARVVDDVRAMLTAAPSVPAADSVRYGCHCDLEPGMEPDGCVLDYGNPNDCIRTRSGRITRREDCDEWRPVKLPAAPADGNGEG